MPVYEFRCEKCEAVTQKFAKSIHSDVSAPVCEACGSKKTHRMISRAMYIQDEATKVEQLDPKYEKMLDDADKPFKADDPLKKVTGTSLYPD